MIVVDNFECCTEGFSEKPSTFTCVDTRTFTLNRLTPYLLVFFRKYLNVAEDVKNCIFQYYYKSTNEKKIITWCSKVKIFSFYLVNKRLRFIIGQRKREREREREREGAENRFK